ncbi:MAG TPA: HEAT repeat domain-containing protein [Terriglobia bacterium]|nr:HEAT repeat domain-containing protein [Terriglobia bacterium]
MRIVTTAARFLFSAFCLLLSAFFLPSAFCFPQQPNVPVRRPKLPEPAPENPAPKNPAASPATGGESSVLPGDWAPELLWSILSSPNPDASEALYDAAFAAGPSLIPQLQAALKDDRTATFAAQCLAYMGGGDSLKILAGLIDDPRDLDLRRFYFGSLGEYRASEATKVLMYALNHSDAEPDRTVTEAAILAFTVRSDPSLVPQLRQAETKITDVVIHDDIENAVEVIEGRAKYLASPEGRRAGASIDEAVQTYFMPALEEAKPPQPARKTTAGGSPRGSKATADKGRAPEASLAKAAVETFTLSPNQTRALAHVVFQDPSALANYDIVLQKEAGDWRVVSVWLGSEVEKPSPANSN